MTTTPTHVAEDPRQTEPVTPRWPLKALLDAARVTIGGLAAELGLAPAAVALAGRRGLSDTQADEWAIRLGLHPLLVWGWAWVDAGPQAGPSHARVAHELRAAIESGELAPGDPLPAVAVLAERFAVGTNTVTRATAELRRECLLVRVGQALRVADPAALPPEPCAACGQPVAPGDGHYPHRPGCTLATTGWCDCDHATHPQCCPACTGARP